MARSSKGVGGPGGGGVPREALEEGAGGSETQKIGYQKWPIQIFPLVNFVFSHDGHFSLELGRGPEGGNPLLLWCTASNTSLVVPPPLPRGAELLKGTRTYSSMT